MCIRDSPNTHKPAFFYWLTDSRFFRYPQPPTQVLSLSCLAVNIVCEIFIACTFFWTLQSVCHFSEASVINSRAVSCSSIWLSSSFSCSASYSYSMIFGLLHKTKAQNVHLNLKQFTCKYFLLHVINSGEKTLNDITTNFVLLYLKEVFAVSTQTVLKISALFFWPHIHWIWKSSTTKRNKYTVNVRHWQPSVQSHLVECTQRNLHIHTSLTTLWQKYISF